MIELIDRFNQVSMLDMPDDISQIYKNVPEMREIDNRGYEICRPLFSHSSLPYNFDLKSVNIKNYMNEEFVYAMYVHHNQKLWIKHIDLIPKNILNLIRDRKGYLLFDNTLEGNRIDKDWFLNPFYKKINQLNLPNDRIIFITNNLLAEKFHDNLNIDNKIKLKSFMWNVYDTKRIINTGHLPAQVNIDDEIQYKIENLSTIKHFLKINRTNRPERNIFMLMMNYHDILKKSLVSFPDLPNEKYRIGFERYLTKKNIDSLRKKVPFNIDKTDEDNQGPAGHGKGFFDADLPFQPIHYKNSFVSIVMAAFPFEPNACHLHSSTFNPMYCGHPIIQFGPVNSLREMRKRGFKTFNKWWDESYDSEGDDWKRLQMIMDLTLEVSRKSNKDLLDIYSDMKDTLQHNVDLIAKYNIKENLYKEIFDE
tara:strand:- start:561 stop:1826 length:1266 start_codon:yes stop_codon:yes gene_type:complete